MQSPLSRTSVAVFRPPGSAIAGGEARGSDLARRSRLRRGRWRLPIRCPVHWGSCGSHRGGCGALWKLLRTPPEAGAVPGESRGGASGHGALRTRATPEAWSTGTRGEGPGGRASVVVKVAQGQAQAQARRVRGARVLHRGTTRIPGGYPERSSTRPSLRLPGHSVVLINTGVGMARFQGGPVQGKQTSSRRVGMLTPSWTCPPWGGARSGCWGAHHRRRWSRRRGAWRAPRRCARRAGRGGG